MTFLDATDKRLRSSTVSSWSDETTRFMFSTISKEGVSVRAKDEGRDQGGLKWKGDRRDPKEFKVQRTLITLGLLSELSQVDSIFLTHFVDVVVELSDGELASEREVKGESPGRLP